MRLVPAVIAALALAACSASPDLTAPPRPSAVRPGLDVAPTVQTFQIGMRLFVSVCAVPTGVVQIPLSGTVQWVVRMVPVGDRLSYGVHTNLQGLTGTLPDGSSVVANGAGNTVYNAFDVSDPSAPFTSTSVNRLYLVQPSTGIVYGTQYRYRVTITPDGATAVSLESVPGDLPTCV